MYQHLDLASRIASNVDYWRRDDTLDSSISRYHRFMMLLRQRNLKRTNVKPLSPTLDILLVWMAHRLHVSLSEDILEVWFTRAMPGHVYVYRMLLTDSSWWHERSCMRGAIEDLPVASELCDDFALVLSIGTFSTWDALIIITDMVSDASPLVKHLGRGYQGAPL